MIQNGFTDYRSRQACFCTRTDHCQMAIIGVDTIADNLPSNVRNFSKRKIQPQGPRSADFFSLSTAVAAFS